MIVNSKVLTERTRQVVNAQEEGDVTTVDLPAQFLQTGIDRELYFNVGGSLVL